MWVNSFEDVKQRNGETVISILGYRVYKGRHGMLAFTSRDVVARKKSCLPYALTVTGYLA